MKKTLFALIFGLAAAPAALACSDPASCHQKNMNDWHYLNEVRPQELERARRQTVPVQYESRYGAVAQSSDGRIWSVNNYPSHEAADARALAGCRERTGGLSCQVIQRYYNTCLALTVDSNNTQLYYANHSSKWKAKRMAMNECKKFYSKCEHYMAECSLPVRIN